MTELKWQFKKGAHLFRAFHDTFTKILFISFSYNIDYTSGNSSICVPQFEKVDKLLGDL